MNDNDKRVITMKDIADKTGFTINTVSQALRNSPKVKKSTKEKIKQTARELGYVHNALAGSLRSGSSYTIAMIVGDISNLHFAIQIHEFEVALRTQGYQLLIIDSDEDEDVEIEAVKTAISRQVDGVIICPSQKSMEPIHLLKQYHVPYVVLGRHFSEGLAVVWDDEKGGYLAGKHLVEQGCKNLLMVNVSDMISSAKEREAGFCRALREADLEPRIIRLSPNIGEEDLVIKEYFEKEPLPDGIFAFSDLIAMEIASRAEECGISIPEDIKLVGFDDILSHIKMPFLLTSISADKSDETRQVLDLLFKQIRNQEKVEDHLYKMEVWLVERKSSRIV